MNKVRVISVQQPYAQMICLGIKQVETRHITTNYRGELYIHASLSYSKYLRKLTGQEPFNQYIKSHLDLPTGCIIGKVIVGDSLPVEQLMPIISQQEKQMGDYRDGRYGWLLRNPELLAKPIPCKGQLGIWYYELPTL